MHCLGRIEAEEMCFSIKVLQLCPKGSISRSEKEDQVYRNHGNFLPRKTAEISWILLLFTRRNYLPSNSILTAAFLVSPRVNFIVNTHIDKWHADHLFCPQVPGDDHQPAICSEEGSGL